MDFAWYEIVHNAVVKFRLVVWMNLIVVRQAGMVSGRAADLSRYAA